MADQDLRPIPTPARQHWREFRVAYLPLITFMALVVLIGWMWKNYVAPATIIGEVETVRAKIISVVAGTVKELKVDRLESVTMGQELAVVTVRDPEQIDAEVAAAEADLRLMQARMDLDKTRNLDSYSRLREQWLAEQLSLALARIHLQQAESEFERTKKLFESELIARGPATERNDFGYDVALRDRDAFRAEVTAREKTASELETGVRNLEAAGAGHMDPSDRAIERAIAAQRESLERLLKPVVLFSPINGFVSVVNHLAGEKVTAGEPILVVSAEKSDRIIAWVRQPIATRPQVGDVVEVRRMRLGERPFEATVVRVGKQLEQINPTAVTLNQTIERAEFGLPLIVQAANTLDLIPGEALQLRIIKHVAGTGAN
jgi:multidrug resistance efflux pump